VSETPPSVPAPWSASPFVPDHASLARLREDVDSCRGCPLYRMSPHAVFGEGSVDADLVLVGEQPGDQEDRQGHPFVGPAGRVLWQCLGDAGIDRAAVYATNAVKHFKHEERGKRRLHQRPTAAEIDACHPWLAAELAAVTARMIVALGASAARSLRGRPTPVGDHRGRLLELGDRQLVVTYHPSAVLRADERAAEVRAAIVADLRLARSSLRDQSRG